MTGLKTWPKYWRSGKIFSSQAHWEVINLLRHFYAKHGLSPMMRILIKANETGIWN